MKNIFNNTIKESPHIEEKHPIGFIIELQKELENARKELSELREESLTQTINTVDSDEVAELKAKIREQNEADLLLVFIQLMLRIFKGKTQEELAPLYAKQKTLQEEYSKMMGIKLADPVRTGMFEMFASMISNIKL